MRMLDYKNQDVLWEQIKGFGESYFISNTGLFKSIKFGKERVVNGTVNYRGYRFVTLRGGGLKKGISIHRLVAIYFIENPQNKNAVNHIDGNKLNNYASNLEWVTDKENAYHANSNGLIKRRKGSNHPCAKLTTTQVNQLKEMYGNGMYRQIDLAKLFNISQGRVSAIIHNQSYK
jgi:hypothetical protein